MPPQNRITSKNLLLAALSPEDLQCYFSDLYPVSLSLRQVLYEAGAPLEHVYFIEEGVASVLTSMADGSTIEVGMIGMEGMVGPLCSAAMSPPNRSSCRFPAPRCA